MLARQQGHIVLVSGAIPGERVVARVERVGKGVVFAHTIDVLSPSPDRRTPPMDPRCGGSVFAHVSYPRQLQLKSEIVRDAFARIGRLPLSSAPDVKASPELGYRMRARLHASQNRLGFFREGTHDLCDATTSGQLLEATAEWIRTTEDTIRRHGLTGLAAIDVGESCSGDERACHLELHGGTDAESFAVLLPGLTGLSAERVDRPGLAMRRGTTSVTDELHVRQDRAGSTLRLRRDVRSFFQSNRFLLETLVRHVVSLVPPGPVLDLYAGVGLFGLSLAAAGAEDVILVEGDPIAAADLRDNAVPYEGRVRVERRSVESFLSGGSSTVPSVAPIAGQDRRARRIDATTVIVDPPRTGLSKDALSGVLALRPARVVYVSCDVATLARDARGLTDAGNELQELTAFDLFPNTAHVETVGVFGRTGNLRIDD